MAVTKCIYGNNKPALLNKNSLRTAEAQFVQKLKNNEDRPKFTCSYKKIKRVLNHPIYKPPLMHVQVSLFADAFQNFFAASGLSLSHLKRHL